MSYVQIIKPGSKAKLDKIPTRAPDGLGKDEAREQTGALLAELAELQELLWGAAQHGLLIVLQGMDAAGKDGTIKNAIGGFNPQGCRVHGFKVPTERERAQDYLWRIHQRTPPKGSVTIFNRSHYEDVLIVRVKGLVPEAEWRERYDDIIAFERLLTRTGTIVVKYFLHISKDEQRERLLDREKEAEKYWKLSPADWVERRRWNDYQEAYEEALSRCSTADAPWCVVPADQKWFRNLALVTHLVETLRPYRDGWMASLEARGRAAKAELDAMPDRE